LSFNTFLADGKKVVVGRCFAVLLVEGCDVIVVFVITDIGDVGIELVTLLVADVGFVEAVIVVVVFFKPNPQNCL